VLEFTAPEGTVLLPRKVAQSLFGRLDAEPSGRVVVSYRLLPSGTFARLQPMQHGFHEALGEHIREVSPDRGGEAWLVVSGC
jgi:ubiquitin fusion degradation protein 1